MADLDLSKISFDKWWKVLASAGAAIAVASIAVKFVPTIFVGLGLLLIGIGEWRMHPEIDVPVGNRMSGGIWTVYPRMSSLSGIACDVLGGLLTLAGLIKLLLA